MADGGEVIFKFLGDDKQLKSVMSGLGAVAKTSLKAIAVGTTAVVAGFSAVVTESVKARGEMEQLAGGAKKIFDEMDFSQIEKDAQEAYKTMNLSASEYISMMNHVGATFASTMGDQKGYEVAKKGMQAIADYASGTGENLNTLNDKYKLITRSAQSYNSIADQFSGILPQTSKDFLEQAKACGYLAKNYKSLKDVPLPEYQEAVTNMIEKGIQEMGLLGNTTMESTQTMTGSIAMLKKSWDNFLSGTGNLGQVVESARIAFQNVLNIVNDAMPDIVENIIDWMPELMQTGVELIGAIGQGIMDNLPMLLHTAGEIIYEIADGISQNMDNMIDSAMDIVTTLVNGLAKNMDSIIEKGIQVIISLINGISKALPDLMPKIVEIIQKIVVTLLAHMPEIIQAGIKLLTALGQRYYSINSTNTICTS